MTDLFLKVKVHQGQNLPFVIYSKPGSDEIIGLFQMNDHVYLAEHFTETGFIMAPFEGENYVLIPEEHAEIITEKFERPAVSEETEISGEYDDSAKQHFEELVEKGVAAIRSGYFKKVVLSRKEKVAGTSKDVEHLFPRLLANYPNAFKYCFYHPKVGMWMGATPEQLLKVKDYQMQTVALAGTQLYEGTENVHWEAKEIEEQHFVTEFILENLKNRVSEEIVSSPYTARAGNLLHIKTDIAAKLNDKESLKQVLEILHPTPAVCGLPKNLAKDFILENEGYDREFYSGFLGELNKNFSTGRSEHSDLYVNLRCMKIKKENIHLYIGCGVTKDSDPEKEFFETLNKSMTMKKILV
ncbi:isochorismate synthase [Flavobacterium cerinum]|uniref:isochorismate synthase n=1 Tax=Flavobacterium cerinum TaxID=2502784 RepID=A0ABY5IPD2_9FLAO|nr:isochorismate synthase [Flavobacterium cerinum]UUC44047.1 isochorismate synthase [Flavobacterium cerinum]